MEGERTEMSDTTTDHQAPDSNPRTTVASVEDSASLLPPLRPREAFLLAYDRFALLASVARRPAMIVAVVSSTGGLLDARLIEDRKSLVLGRHTQCALRLPDSAVSLRHLCALVRFEDNEPRIRLWDLNTGLHFITEDEEHTTEITRIAPPLLLRDDDEPEVAWGVLRLERDGYRQERGVSAERLEQGILVGRYERCGLLMSSENSEVSRVHLLLVRIGTE